MLGGTLVLASAARGGRVAWVVPSYKNGRPLWQWIESATRGLEAAGLCKVNRSERTVDFPTTGGFLGVYSASDNADAMRGDKFHLAILDEAARIPEEAWTSSIQPTLADLAGHAILISTPKGQNWFWREWMRGQDRRQSEVISFTAPSSANPNPHIQRAAYLAKERVPDRVYRQEWLAEFIADAGGVFHDVRSNIQGALEKRPPNPYERYAIGVDLAKYQDYTVAVVINIRDRRVVDFHRFNTVDWNFQEQAIYTIARHWNCAHVIVDATGVGDPIYDALSSAQARDEQARIKAPIFEAFHINTNLVKRQLIDNAVLLVQKHEIAYPHVPELINELEAYQYTQLPGGSLRMEAPEGLHDDCVIAFALACWELQYLNHAPLPQVDLPVKAKTGKDILDAALIGFGGADLLDKTF